MADIREDATKFVEWLSSQIIEAARGDRESYLEVDPRGKYWLGRLATEEEVMSSPFGDRSERMAPCAIGIRIKPKGPAPWCLKLTASACAWWRDRTMPGVTAWRKTPVFSESKTITVEREGIDSTSETLEELSERFADELDATVLQAAVRIDVERGRGGATEIVVSMVNESPESSNQLADTGLYQVQLQVSEIDTVPFLLESLPDSYRYDRRIAAYGINCGIEVDEVGRISTTDTPTVNRSRPIYWSVDAPLPDFSFENLAHSPIESLEKLVEEHEKWGESAWSKETLDRRAIAENWSDEMRASADEGAGEFWEESNRIKRGLGHLRTDDSLLRSFRLMNQSMEISSRGKYDSWRPFQIGFILANIESILSSDDAEIVDILWFATGGGKTETYLGLLVMAAFHDRITGKKSGMTAWSRFPLRLLSLQQTQRFADATAAAEIVRRKVGIEGDPFSMGFFVGDSSTPNRVLLDPPAGKPDSLDPSMPARFQVLLRCPFCDGDVTMKFDRALWRLMHCCSNDDCPWPEDGLPIYIVDEEIFRFLPTIVVGTLDKVALISMQAAMRGFIASPYGVCSQEGHGFTYAPRSSRPHGCLVPGCSSVSRPLTSPAKRFAPTFRLQDELHLLRDSLGAIDSHYEGLLDHLEGKSSDIRPKVVASSATLTGFERQCEVLYQRKGRVFPTQGPRAELAFWTTADKNQLLRKFIALAPRGATLEFAADRSILVLQESVRRLVSDPGSVCSEIEIDPANVQQLVSLFGTNVIYGNTIRDLDACARSLETQVPIDPLVTAQLTGHTPFEDVRNILERLEKPESEFDERIHVVTASSMMSHGVDINRLNTMIMLGHPLTTAEFMQATARIGRTFPGVVFVLHKMPLERDASLFRSFKSFVEQGDRFVEAIPITRRSRKVLERTLPGLMMARLLHLHEINSGQALTLITRVRDYFSTQRIDAKHELSEIVSLLHIDVELEPKLCEEAHSILSRFFDLLHDPAVNKKFPNELFANPVMRSLRDVEEQSPIFD
ncbi:helicase-related protein [Bremerella sp.]|uniref:helicase-related protein n=1 Tax=Bremerella sp. TaxID=2795602 RepID=UPI00391B0BA3